MQLLKKQFFAKDFGGVGLMASKTGNESNLWAAIAYVLQILGPLGILAAIIIYFQSKDSFVRFSALQAVLFDIAVFAVALVLMFSLVGAILLPVLYLAALVAWLFLVFKAWNGEKVLLPVIGGLAQKNA